MTIPPDTRAALQTGHIGDHNNIADVLTAFQNQLTALPGFAFGTANLTAGTVTINNSQVQAASIVFLGRMAPAGTLGHLSVPTITPGVSFVVQSSSATETSQIGYLIKI